MVLAPQSPELALIEAQVTSGKVEWDLAENSNLGAFTLAGKDMLETIDYARWTRRSSARSTAAVKGEYSVWHLLLVVPAGLQRPSSRRAHPANWADFWDVERSRRPRGMTEMDFEPPPLETALLAQGVAPDELYPLDIDAAFRSLDEIRPHITKWTGFGANAT